jgi:hypothetical protein
MGKVHKQKTLDPGHDGCYLTGATSRYLPGRTELAATMTLLGILGRAAARPRLIGSMLRAGWRFRARGWWRRPPFLPVPPSEYVEWRLHTAYGDTGREPTGEEMERYVRWANRLYRGRRARGGVT